MRPWPGSLGRRILLVELMAIAIVIAVLPFVTISLLHRTMSGYQGRLLQAQAEQIGHELRLEHGRIRVQLDQPLQVLFASAYDGRAFALIDARRHVLAHSLAGDVPIELAPLEATPRLFRSSPYVGVSQPVAMLGARLWVIVTQKETEPGAILDDVASAFLWRYVAVLVLALALLPLVNALLIRRMVANVQRVAARASRIGPANLDVRLEEGDLPSEIADLVGVTNRLLDRLQAAFDQQRQFVANLVHELKTPLGAFRVQLDEVAPGATKERMKQSAERLSHVVSQMQDLATLESLSSETLRPCDLCALARRTVSTMAPDIFARGDTIALDLPSGPVERLANEAMLELALANLIDNASRHTPAGTSVTVGVSLAGAIEIVDDGPGIASDHQSMLTRRFWRSDRSRADTAGLGLSIVERIVSLHRGALVIGKAPKRGARFAITLPDENAHEHPGLS